MGIFDFLDKEVFIKEKSEEVKIDNTEQLKKKNQELELLLDISEVALGSLGDKDVLQKIVDSVPEKLGSLGYLGGILALYNKETEKIGARAVTKSVILNNKIGEMLEHPFSEYFIYANKDYNLTVETIKTGKIQIAGEGHKFISPPINKKAVDAMQSLAGVRSCAALPIFVRGETIGAFIFLIGRPPEKINERDMILMKIFVKHISASVENAMLFEKMSNQFEELARVKNDLEEMLSMKNDFLRIVSHQLRTPLTAIRGFVSMWQNGDFDGLAAERIKEIKERIGVNIDHLNNIINDMIMAMESEGAVRLAFAPVDVGKIIKNSIKMLKGNYDKKGLYLKYDKPEENILKIEADARYLSYVFANIIDNAEKYTESGGLKISIAQDAKNIYIRFIDTGIGIKAEDKDRIFEKFSRGGKAAKSNPNGSGLGLFIAKQIIEEHGGKLQLSSLGEDTGSTFVVELPIKQLKLIKEKKLFKIGSQTKK